MKGVIAQQMNHSTVLSFQFAVLADHIQIWRTLHSSQLQGTSFKRQCVVSVNVKVHLKLLVMFGHEWSQSIFAHNSSSNFH